MMWLSLCVCVYLCMYVFFMFCVHVCLCCYLKYFNFYDNFQCILVIMDFKILVNRKDGKKVFRINQKIIVSFSFIWILLISILLNMWYRMNMWNRMNRSVQKCILIIKLKTLLVTWIWPILLTIALFIYSPYYKM